MLLLFWVFSILCKCSPPVGMCTWTSAFPSVGCIVSETASLHLHKGMCSSTTSSRGVLTMGWVFSWQNKQLEVDIIQELGLSKYLYRQETFTNESGFMIFRANAEGRPYLYITHISFISSSQRRIRWNIEIVWFWYFCIETTPSLPLDTWHPTFPEGAWDPAGALHHILRIYCAWRFPGSLDRYQTNKFQLCLQPTNSNKTKFLLEKSITRNLIFTSFWGVSIKERNNHFLPIPAEISLLANLTPVSPPHLIL